MSQERYFLEAWLSKGVKGSENIETERISHAHITFVRPFSLVVGKEQVVKNKIVDYCRSKKPIPFVLEGEGDFDDEINYIPVIGDEIYKFDSDMEMLLEEDVLFAEKLGRKKILHLTTTTPRPSPLSRTELFMLRLTCICNKRILFSFDFVTQEILNREESLDQTRWSKTCQKFSQENS